MKEGQTKTNSTQPKTSITYVPNRQEKEPIQNSKRKNFSLGKLKEPKIKEEYTSPNISKPEILLTKKRSSQKKEDTEDISSVQNKNQKINKDKDLSQIGSNSSQSPSKKSEAETVDILVKEKFTSMKAVRNKIKDSYGYLNESFFDSMEPSWQFNNFSFFPSFVTEKFLKRNSNNNEENLQDNENKNYQLSFGKNPLVTLKEIQNDLVKPPPSNCSRSDLKKFKNQQKKNKEMNNQIQKYLKSLPVLKAPCEEIFQRLPKFNFNIINEENFKPKTELISPNNESNIFSPKNSQNKNSNENEENESIFNNDMNNNKFGDSQTNLIAFDEETKCEKLNRESIIPKKRALLLHKIKNNKLKSREKINNNNNNSLCFIQNENENKFIEIDEEKEKIEKQSNRISESSIIIEKKRLTEDLSFYDNSHYDYECTTCHLKFKTHQGLGGHISKNHGKTRKNLVNKKISNTTGGTCNDLDIMEKAKKCLFEKYILPKHNENTNINFNDYIKTPEGKKEINELAVLHANEYVSLLMELEQSKY